MNLPDRGDGHELAFAEAEVVSGGARKRAAEVAGALWAVMP